MISNTINITNYLKTQRTLTNVIQRDYVLYFLRAKAYENSQKFNIFISEISKGFEELY